MSSRCNIHTEEAAGPHLTCFRIFYQTNFTKCSCIQVLEHKAEHWRSLRGDVKSRGKKECVHHSHSRTCFAVLSCGPLMVAAPPPPEAVDSRMIMNMTEPLPHPRSVSLPHTHSLPLPLFFLPACLSSAVNFTLFIFCFALRAEKPHNLLQKKRKQKNKLLC